MLSACTDDHDTTGPQGSSTVTFSFQRLEPLPAGLNYQAWALEQDGAAFVGHPLAVFDVNESGQLVTPVSGSLITSGFPVPLDPEDVFGFGLSIEASNTPVIISSATFLMGGPVAGGVAQMTTDFWFGIDLDFSGAQGRYILATPTDDDGTNELSGLWFLDPFQGPSAPGLALPAVGDGWDYEGWVEVDGRTLSTGKFLRVDAADGGFSFGGTIPGPDVPGEDFLRLAPTGLEFPTDLSGGKVFVTIEPWQHWDVAPDEPFFIRLLEADIPADANPNTVYAMASLVDQLPRGSATVQ
jgi:hypothetical protein